MARDVGEYVYNGLYRYDNLLGYTIDNVVPCCGKCNRMKMDLSIEELFEHMRKMLGHFCA